MENLQIETKLYDDESIENYAVLARLAQKELETAWFYSRKMCPDLTDKLYHAIENYNSVHLMSRADKFDQRMNYAKACEILAEKGDCVIISDEIYRPMESVGRSRKHGFSFNFYHYLLIAYYPAANKIESTTYVAYH